MNSPLNIKNVAMTGAWVRVLLEPEWLSFTIQLRTAADLLVRAPGTTNYYTIKSGANLTFACGHLTADYVELYASNGTVAEIAANVRA